MNASSISSSHAKDIAVLCMLLMTSGIGVRGATQRPQLQQLDARVAELYEEGKYAEAIPWAQEAIRMAEKSLGPDHPEVAASLNNLAEIYRALGKFTEAEPLFQRAVRIKEKALASDDPSLAISLNNLAELYFG